MKILDEKGKLFGKLNIIDLLALLVILAALVFVVFKFVARPSTPAETVNDPSHLVYTVQINGVNDKITQEIERQLSLAGGRDQLMANGVMVDNSYITALRKEVHVNYLTDEKGQVVISKDSGPDARYDLTFTVEATVPDPTTNLVGTQEVRVGKSHILKTVHIELNGVITSCDWG